MGRGGRARACRCSRLLPSSSSSSSSSSTPSFLIWQALVDRFDGDGDGQLTEAEYGRLVRFLAAGEESVREELAVSYRLIEQLQEQVEAAREYGTRAYEEYTKLAAQM